MEFLLPWTPISDQSMGLQTEYEVILISSATEEGNVYF